MSKIKYYIDDVRRNGEEVGEDLLSPSPTLFYHFAMTEGTAEEKTGWTSYESFKDDEFEYRAAFWEAVQYWYEDNNSIRFDIDKKRDDSAYHYIEYIDSIPIRDGYTFYTSLHTEKEKKAWLEGVKKFNSTAGINTPIMMIFKGIADSKFSFDHESDKWPKEKDLLIPSIPTSIAKIVKDLATNSISDDFLEHVFELMKGRIPTKKAALQYAFNAASFNLDLKYQKLLGDIKELGVKAFLNPVISKILEMVEQHLSKADILYNEIKRVANKPIRIYRQIVEAGKYKDDKDNRELIKKYTEDFKKYLNNFSDEVKELVYEVFYLDILVKIIHQIKTIGNTSVAVWRNIVSEAKTLRDMDISDLNSTVVPKLQAILKALLPLLGGLIGAMYGMECGKLEDSKSDLGGRRRLLDNKTGKDKKPDYNDLDSFMPEEEGDIDIPTIEESLNNDLCETLPEEIEATLFDVAIVYVKAFYDLDCFSLIGNEGSGGGGGGDEENSTNDSSSSKELTPEECFPCKISMCETSDDTDVEDLMRKSLTGGNGSARKVCVEIGQDLFPISRLCVEVNQHIHIDDIIGYINEVPIHSKVDCSVQIVEPSYFVAWYYFEDFSDSSSDASLDTTNEEDCTKIINDYYTNAYEMFKDRGDKYQELVDFYKNSAYVDLFIKDYLSFFRFPELALFTRDYSYTKSYHSSVLQDMFRENFGVSSGYRVANGNEVSSDKFIEKYEDAAHDIIDGYEKTVKKKAGKKKVKELIKKNKTTTLKNTLYEEKKKFTNDILKLYYDNPGKMNYCSKGRIVDFMLCDNWIEYLHNDNFFYDDENPYVKELSDAISKFIGIRERLELNKNNIESLISKFNQYCDPVLKKYWFGYTSKYTYVNNYNRDFDYDTTYDYFARFKEVFKFEYYLDTDSIEEGSADDEGTISLFKRVYKYLKTLVGIKTNEPAGIEITEDTDVTALLESYDKMEEAKETEDDKLDRKLRQIAHRYVSLIRIENGMTESKIMGSQYTYIANEYKNIDNIMSREYNGGETDDIIMQVYFEENEKVLSQYLQNLKTITANELATLQGIAKKAIDWYNKNSETFYNDSLFEQFREVPWPDKMDIWHECIKTDYYLFTDIFNEKIMNDIFVKLGGGEIDYEPSAQLLPGEGTIPIKTMDDLDKLEQKIAEDDKRAEKDEDLSTSVHTKSTADFTKHKYWLKYCLHATLVNCMVPLFWATGLVIAGSPILLPIIYIPLVVIPGRTVCVLGLGLCGIIPMPMLLFVNAHNANSTIIVPLNVALDIIVMILERLGQLNFNGLNALLTPLIKNLDREIQNYEDMLLDIDYQREQVNTTVIDKPRTEFLVKDDLNKEVGEDRTSHNEETPVSTTTYAQETMYGSYLDKERKEIEYTYVPYSPPPGAFKPTGESAENAGLELFYKSSGFDFGNDGGLLTLSDYGPAYPERRDKSYENVIVFLDPGHDYKTTHNSEGKLTQKASPAAMYPDINSNASGGPAIEEYEYNRLIAQQVASILYETAPYITVKYTVPSLGADDGWGKEFTKRKRMAADTMKLPENRNKHAVFVSIHLNAAGGGRSWSKMPSGHGFWSVYVSTDTHRANLSAPLANSLFDVATQYLGNSYVKTFNGGVKYGNSVTAGTALSDYSIVSPMSVSNNGDYWSKIPSVITENMFQDVPADANFIVGHVQELAEINAFGILDFVDKQKDWVLNNESYLNV